MAPCGQARVLGGSSPGSVTSAPATGSSYRAAPAWRASGNRPSRAGDHEQITALAAVTGADPVTDRVDRLAVAEVNEQLVTGREDVYFGFQFAKAANKLSDDAVRYYVEALAADPEALRGCFAAYRALDATIAQNEQRKTRRLTPPVLAIGGAEGIGEGAANTMRLAADDVQSVVIPGRGRYCLEEAPQEVLATLTAFLAPYRESI